MDCFLCKQKIIENMLFESKFWNVTLSKDQAYLGRCYISLIRHAGSLADLKKEEWDEFSEIVKKLETALKKSFDATMFNWSCSINDAYKDENPKPHVHWHFRPRYRKEINFADSIFKDTEFAHHYDNKRKVVVSEEILHKIAEKIIGCL